MRTQDLLMNNKPYMPDQTNKLSESGWLFVRAAMSLVKKGNWEVIPNSIYLRIRYNGASLVDFTRVGICYLYAEDQKITEEIFDNPYCQEDMTKSDRFPIQLQEKHVHVILERVLQLNPSIRQSSLELLMTGSQEK